MCIRDRHSPVDIQKPAVNRLGKIAAKGGAPDKEITADQRKQSNNILNKYEMRNRKTLSKCWFTSIQIGMIKG